MVENDQQRFVLVVSRKAFSCSGCRRMQPENTDRLFDNERLVNGFPKCYCPQCAAELKDYTENPDQMTGASVSLPGNQPVKYDGLQDALKRIAELERKEKVQARYISEMLGRIATLEQQAKAAEPERPWYLDTPPTPANNA